MTDKIKYFLVEVPYGAVYVSPVRDGKVHITTEYPDYDYQQREFEGDGTTAGLTVNNVDYHITAWLDRDTDGRWKPSSTLYVNRRTGREDATRAAEKKVKETLYLAVAEWLESDASGPLMEMMAAVQRSEDNTEVNRLLSRLDEINKEAEEIKARLAVLGAKLDG